MDLTSINTQSFYKRSIAVAEHYGFRSIEDIAAMRANSPAAGDRVTAHTSPHDRLDYQAIPEALRAYASAVELKKKEPFMFYSPTVVMAPGRPSEQVYALTLSTVGTHDPLSDVVVLKAAMSIVEELGIKRPMVRVNSVGDHDSIARFVREISAQLRSRTRDLSDTLQEQFRTNPSATLAHLFETRHPVTHAMPGPIDFLTAPSRKYFKEVLELLEHSNIPFELDDRLYGDHRTYNHTIFEVITPSDSETIPHHTIARGGRYDNLTKTYTRGVVPATGIVVAVRAKTPGEDPAIRPRRKKPNACLIHIGREAQICSIGIIDHLRREKIAIEQCLQYERFSEQLAYAETHNVKYVVILGQREVHEGKAIVRNSSDRSQQSVPIGDLAQYLRTIGV